MIACIQDTVVNFLPPTCSSGFVGRKNTIRLTLLLLTNNLTSLYFFSQIRDIFQRKRERERERERAKKHFGTTLGLN